MLDILFPYSYAALIIGALIGIGITAAVLGFMSMSVIVILIYIGMIRILPLFHLITKVLSTILPTQISKLKDNIKDSFKVRFTEQISEGRYIYTWHPHGVFCNSHIFHIGTAYTNWPKHLRNIKGVTLSTLLWLPFTRELMEYFSGIPSDYHSMKNALTEGNSISVAAGGMREMLGDYYIVKRRRGIFKMALETGTPIVPVLSFGENKLFSIVDINPKIQKWLESYDICICIPTMNSIYKWLGMIQSPLKDPIISVAGSPIKVDTILNPTEQDINELRERYIEALRELFIKENPNKTEEFVII
jgi:hypothetical protein